MKAFTDLEQSKKLADILPLESADMSWVDYGYCKRLLPKDDIDSNTYPIIIPAWSLATLIGVLPRYLNYTGGQCPLKLLTFDFENPHRKDHCWIVGYWHYDEEYEKYNFQMKAREEEVIDACYELILKLHEHKLI